MGADTHRAMRWHGSARPQLGKRTDRSLALRPGGVGKWQFVLAIAPASRRDSNDSIVVKGNVGGALGVPVQERINR